MLWNPSSVLIFSKDFEADIFYGKPWSSIAMVDTGSERDLPV
jgi:hypothetical protein